MAGAEERLSLLLSKVVLQWNLYLGTGPVYRIKRDPYCIGYIDWYIAAGVHYIEGVLIERFHCTLMCAIM